MDLDWLGDFFKWIRETVWRNMDTSLWVYLPDTVLIQIYHNLSDQDRANMALVCTSWYRTFHTPCLWRKRRVELGGYRAVMLGGKACKFASRYGKYLHHVIINCNHPSNQTCKIVQKNIEEFLDKIKSARLITFDFGRLELDRFWKHEHLREKVVESLSVFLKSQERIEEFEMSSANCSLTYGCKILGHLGYGSGRTLKTLSIEDFFQTRTNVFQFSKYWSCIRRYTALTDISVNYNCLSDDIMEIFCKNLAGKLTRMLIKVYRPDPHYHRISGHTWKLLKKLCPRLTVEVWFESLGSATDIIPILVPQMPLEDVHIWTGYQDEIDWSLPETINHITTHFSKTLNSLSLELDNTDEIIDDALLHLVRTCPLLTELTVNASMYVTTAEIICELRREDKLKLQLCHLTFCGLTDIEWAELSFLRVTYEPMFEEKKLDFKIHSDLIIDN